MTLEQLGNLGEFFGSVAVLITLIYLTVQVRFARMDSRAALLQHRNDSARDIWLCEATNERLANLIAKGDERLGREIPVMQRLMAEVDFSADEARSVMALVSAHFFHRQTLFQSDLSEEERRALDAQLRSLFTRGVYGVWFDSVAEAATNTGFDKSFVRHVASLRAEAQ